MKIPQDYLERVYAGVLGKIIGVYLGRPFEGWNYERILNELGEIWGYVHEKRGVPLIVTDDDISGTFTFIRALEDYGCSKDISPAQNGQTWLNYLIEGKTILSWAGLGCSAEHTAYLRLKHGIPAPQSGSIEMNGPFVAQQIGAQIFIDTWAMVAPGDPELAADLARRAASVSHDGEAIYGAQLLAGMEALAFVERDLEHLLDAGLRLIPEGCDIARMVNALRNRHAIEPDWHVTREWIQRNYGYGTYPGDGHIVPNSALIFLGLLYGDDDFRKSLMITNTSGWDTDCNSGNLGCLLGIKNGLEGIDTSPVDWRGPVADRLYLPSADGGRAISDAATEANYVANLGRRLAGEKPLYPKAAASPVGKCRFHFALPGSVQGFHPSGFSPEKITLKNVPGHSHFGERSLLIQIDHLEKGDEGHIATNTFMPPEALHMPGYDLLASPSLYPGQTVRAYLEAGTQNQIPSTTRLYLQAYNPDGSARQLQGPSIQLTPGMHSSLVWKLPETHGAPIFEIGLAFDSPGLYYLDALTWDGTPHFTYGPRLGEFKNPGMEAQTWRQAWINGVQHWEWWSEEPYRFVQNEGVGMLISGCREWQDYRLKANLRAAFLSKQGGIAVRVQGTRRYYGLFLTRQQTLRLVKELDGSSVLAEIPLPLEAWQPVEMEVRVIGGDNTSPVQLTVWIDGKRVIEIIDTQNPLISGGIALVTEESHLLADQISVIPVDSH